MGMRKNPHAPNLFSQLLALNHSPVALTKVTENQPFIGSGP